jgi:hypothetical protein
MKVALIGSRSFNNYTFFKEAIKHEPITHIISGGARGADYFAECYAHETGLPITVFLAEWDKYGKSAGYIRNESIVNAADKIIAFWDGESKGTQHTINLANKKRVPVRVILFSNERKEETIS